MGVAILLGATMGETHDDPLGSPQIKQVRELAGEGTLELGSEGRRKLMIHAEESQVNGKLWHNWPIPPTNTSKYGPCVKNSKGWTSIEARAWGVDIAWKN